MLTWSHFTDTHMHTNSVLSLLGDNYIQVSSVSACLWPDTALGVDKCFRVWLCVQQTVLEDRDCFSLWSKKISELQIRSVAQSCPTLCDPMNHSMPGLPVRHQLLEFTETHVHWVSDAIQPSDPLSSPSPLAPNPSQHQSLFQWVDSSHEVAKVLEFQL